ncbi:hypothetical protein FNH09_01375 [Streptomyces adustus]|uniref:Uncharacterized protein n=1 Tax=Streptomyces adustus TaxID=1609272 RepID=A0A5N8V558_9ACTN|nr:hypothetical protein [Streptomyces adustus]MPY30026.1 hypothetical protein [Streptomyces adustus]
MAPFGVRCGVPLEQFLEPTAGEPANGADLKRLATVQTFGAAWPRSEVLDTRTRALVSVAEAARDQEPGGTSGS